MDVIDLCDSDDETDTRQEPQNQRLDAQQNFLSALAANTATSRRTAATKQRPRSISSASNNPAQSNDEGVSSSDDDNIINGHHQPRNNNLSVQQRSPEESPMVRPMTAREKSWAMFQKMRREAVKETTSASKPAAAAPKKAPPAQVLQEQRKRKLANSSSSDPRKQSAGPSSVAKKPAGFKVNNNGSTASRRKPSFLGQGLDTNASRPKKAPPHDQGVANPLFSSMAPFQPMGAYDMGFSIGGENLDDLAALELAKPSPSPTGSSPSGSTLQAAIEIDSDDDDDVIEVQQQKNFTTREDSREREVGRTQQGRRESTSLGAAEHFHPLLQLDSPPKAGQRQNREDQASSTAQFSIPLSQESESIVQIMNHRFKAGEVLFVVKDCYGNVHREITFEDLKVDAPALLSHYILGKSKGNKLCKEKFRLWALKTRKKIKRKAKKSMTRQEQKIRDNGRPREARAASTRPPQSMAQSSRVTIDDEDEGEFEFGSSPTSGKKSPNIAPIPEARDSAVSFDSRSNNVDDETKENCQRNETSAADAGVATTKESETHAARPSSPFSAPSPNDEQGDDANTTKDPSPPNGTNNVSSGNEFEEPASVEDSNDRLINDNREDGGRSAVPELNEEILAEPRDDDSIFESEPLTQESIVVGLGPAYTFSQVAMGMEGVYDDSDDEIEVVNVKSPARREDKCSSPLQDQQRATTEQTVEDMDDDSDESVLSVSPPISSSPTGQFLAGSGETPIGIDDNVEPATRKEDHSSPLPQNQEKAREEQMIQDEDDGSDESVLSTSPPISGNETRQPFAGSSETPIDVDDDAKPASRREDESPSPQIQQRVPAEQTALDVDNDSDESVLSISPPISSSATRRPLAGSSETPIDVDDDDSVMEVDEIGRPFSTAKKRASPPPTSYSYSERRFVFHERQPRRPPLSARRPTASTWSYGWSCDAAMKEQERLFQQSAAKMRSQATARVVATSVARQQSIKFQEVVPNIAEKYPLHWQFSDYFARLGLPEGSSETVIKKQYRRLALLYHPDKSQVTNTATKFQNITEAYRALLAR